MPANKSLFHSLGSIIVGLVLLTPLPLLAAVKANQEITQAKPVRTEIKRFSFELRDCRRLGDRVTCEVLITNEDQDRRLQINDSTRIIDDAGNQITVTKTKFGAENSYDQQLVTGVPVKAILVFEPVGADISHINLLEIYCREGESNSDDFSAQLRNIQLTIVNPSSSLESTGAPKPNVVIKKEFTFALNSCVRSAKDVICSFGITNEGSETKNLSLHVNCVNEKVRMIDEAGNEYLATQGSAGTEVISSGGFGRCFTRETLAPRATTKGIVKFSGVDPAAKTIKLLRMIFGQEYQSGEFTVDFRDIPLSQGPAGRT